MRTVLAILACCLCSCAGINRIAFTVGYDKATFGVEIEPKSDGKNPIARRSRSGK